MKTRTQNRTPKRLLSVFLSRLVRFTQLKMLPTTSALTRLRPAPKPDLSHVTARTQPETTSMKLAATLKTALLSRQPDIMIRTAIISVTIAAQTSAIAQPASATRATSFQRLSARFAPSFPKLSTLRSSAASA